MFWFTGYNPSVGFLGTNIMRSLVVKDVQEVTNLAEDWARIKRSAFWVKNVGAVDSTLCPAGLIDWIKNALCVALVKSAEFVCKWWIWLEFE